MKLLIGTYNPVNATMKRFGTQLIDFPGYRYMEIWRYEGNYRVYPTVNFSTLRAWDDPQEEINEAYDSC